MIIRVTILTLIFKRKVKKNRILELKRSITIFKATQVWEHVLGAESSSLSGALALSNFSRKLFIYIHFQLPLYILWTPGMCRVPI